MLSSFLSASLSSLSSRFIWQILLAAPAGLGAFFSSPAIAATVQPWSTVVIPEAATNASTSVSNTSVSNTSVQVAQSASPVEPSATSLSQVSQYGSEGSGNVQTQVTSISQLSDVQPTDWAFQALQSLVERYGCIVGYPDATYKGSRGDNAL